MLSHSSENAMTIPEFPEFAPIELSHKPEVDAALAAMERPISEWSFANLYLFRDAHKYRLSRLGGLVLILAQGYDGSPYAFPPWGKGDVEGAAKNLCALLLQSAPEALIYPVPESMFGEVFSGPGWKGEEDRDGADYVYLAENLATLPGQKYHKKKNRLAKYLREINEDWSYAPLTGEYADQCAAIAEGWCEERCSIERPSTYLETRAAVEAVRLRAELGLSGGVILSGGRVVAWCLGEPLSGDTFVMHFEKGLPGVDGPAQLINKEFCANGLSGYKYVNREQDLGNPGLRQAKESYHPEYLAAKFKVRPG